MAEIVASPRKPSNVRRRDSRSHILTSPPIPPQITVFASGETAGAVIPLPRKVVPSALLPSSSNSLAAALLTRLTPPEYEGFVRSGFVARRIVHLTLTGPGGVIVTQV